MLATLRNLTAVGSINIRINQSVGNWIAIFIFGLILSSCGDSPAESVTPGLVRAFEKSRMELRADPHEVVFDREITFTASTMPLLSGKGRFVFNLSPNTVDSLNITSPLVAKLSTKMSDSLKITFDTTFVAGEAISKEIRFRIPRHAENRRVYFTLEARAWSFLDKVDTVLLKKSAAMLQPI